MTLYQRRFEGEVVGDPAPLPPELVGLPDNVLAEPEEHLSPATIIRLAMQGVSFVPVAAPSPIPARVPKLYAKLALKQAGKLGDVETYMASLAEDADDRLYWANATHIERASPLTVNLGAGFGLDAEALDGLFLLADGLRIADGALP